jgi:hypothetical protein
MRSCRQPSAVTVFSEWYFLTVNRPPFSPAPFHRELHEHDPALARARRTRAEQAKAEKSSDGRNGLFLTFWQK